MTDFSTVPDAPRSDNPDLLAALAADLLALDYTVDGVAELLGEEAHQALGRDQTVPAALVLRESTEPLATVCKLWLLAQDIQKRELTAVLPSLSVETLSLMGLIEAVPGADRVRAAIDLRPYGWPANGKDGIDTDLWVASDLGAHQRPGVLRHDHVLGIGQASLTLAQGTIRREVDKALDVGTGCGIQLFHLLQHAKTVVATDISIRALAFTRFNLLLNAPALGLNVGDVEPNDVNPAGTPERVVPRVSLRHGSLLEPVAGESFDLIVSNPPFVITPRHFGEDAGQQFTYRDGGLAGDAIVERLVRGLPAVLAPGGTAQMLGNWEIKTTANDAGAPVEWSDRPRLWIPEGVQAWFIQREQVSPGGYAETWLQDASQGRESQAYMTAYENYVLDFASRAVAGIGFGYILLRTPAAGESVPEARFEEILYPIEQPVGPHLAAALDRERWLEDRESIHDELLVVAEDVTEERHQRPGAEHPGVILLRQGAGLRRTNLLSTELAGFVSASDGDLSVAALIGALADLLDRPDAEFSQNLYTEVCNLVRDGFLLPA